jgi:arylsulfatase A-like enzyme
MPALRSLMETSAYTMTAKTSYPSATLPAHSSMLGGTCPAKHKALWNDYLPWLGYARGTDLFDLAHEAGLKTVMFVGKEKLRQVTEPTSLDVYRFINDRDLVIVESSSRTSVDFGLMLALPWST